MLFVLVPEMLSMGKNWGFNISLFEAKNEVYVLLSESRNTDEFDRITWF